MKFKPILAGLLCAVLAWWGASTALAKSTRSVKKTVTRRSSKTTTEVYPALVDEFSYPTLTQNTAVDLEIPPQDVAPSVAASSIELERAAKIAARRERTHLIEQKTREPIATTPAAEASSSATASTTTLAAVIDPGPVSAEPTEPAKAAPTRQPKYYVVPSNKTDSVIRRIQLVEYILKHYGRAYDYRAMTSRQLEDVLADLRRAERSAPTPTALAE